MAELDKTTIQAILLALDRGPRLTSPHSHICAGNRGYEVSIIFLVTQFRKIRWRLRHEPTWLERDRLGLLS
jgi:hypothetical protein